MLLISTSAYAGSVESKLHSILDSINFLKNRIFHVHKKQSSLKNQLKTLEIKAAGLHIKLRNTYKRIEQLQQDLRYLNWQNHENQVRLLQQKQYLASELRAVYVLSRKSYLKILLSGEDPIMINRLITYNRFLQKYRFNRLRSISVILNEIANNKKERTNHLVALQKTAQEQRKTYQELSAVKYDRSHLLGKMNEKLNSDQKKLVSLISDKKALEKVLARLRSEATAEIFATPLSKLKHKLYWPVAGHVVEKFGEKIAHSQLRRNGVVIEAKEGATIRAIANGKVVFSEWLDGYGLLLIINHGHGYMSLYGRNEFLYKKVGDIVHAGEPIAAVGESGGFTKYGLYFALRKNGEAINPSLWCA